MAETLKTLKNQYVAHLRMHSHFSVGQSASTPYELISELTRLNKDNQHISAAALTDYNSLSGTLKFSNGAASAKSFQPIIGYDCKVALKRHGAGVGRILLLAMSDKGFRKLCEIQALAYQNIEHPVKKNEGENPYLAILLDDLLACNEDLILLTGKHEEGLLYKLYKDKNQDIACDIGRKLLKAFGDRMYVEFCRNASSLLEETDNLLYDSRHQSELFLQSLMRGALGDIECDDGVTRSFIPPVATTDIWYASSDRHVAWKIMQSNYQKTNLTVSGIPAMAVPDDLDSEAMKAGPPYFMKGVGDFQIHLDDADRYHIRGAEDVYKLFSDMPYAVRNTTIIAARCHFHPEGRNPVLPPFQKTINGKVVNVNESEELKEQSFEGLEERLVQENKARARIRREKGYSETIEDDNYRVIKFDESDAIYKTYIDRLKHELETIINMEFPGYFLIVSDFIKKAKSMNIPVGPGRGSGAGSLVAYSLKITNVDPMKYGLLFERFLNPERVSMPDFDIDFCQTRREEVIKYVTETYGSDHVSQIATFGQIKPKSSIGTIQRSLVINEYSFTHNDTDITSKALSSNASLSDVPLYYYYQDDKWLKERGEKFVGIAEDMRLLIKNEKSDTRRNLFIPASDKDKKRFGLDGDRIGVPKVAALMNFGSLISGLYKSRGAHAAGVIIGGDKLTNLFPTMMDEVTLKVISAYDQKDSEASGAVKFDFLGLKNLTVIQDAVDYAKEFASFYKNGFFSDNGKPNDLTIDDILLDDKHVFETITTRGQIKACGIFQLASAGMQRVIEKIQPDSLANLCAINALYRPGPQQYIDSFAKRRNGDENIIYPGNEADTKPILEETYGYMIYQEQVMQVAQKVAGYSLGGADLLRRAMGKKIAAEMEKQRQVFVHGDGDKTPGAVKYSNMTPEDANKLFDDINAFANYGFNKSHALAYALVAYQTMWLKTYYTACFLAAVATYESKSLDANEAIVNEARVMGVPVLAPDMNKSRLKFAPEIIDESTIGIRYGFSGLKRLVHFDPEENRPDGGYVDIFDVLVRNPALNKSAVENIINSGALDNVAFNVKGWVDLPDTEQDQSKESVIASKIKAIEGIDVAFEEQKEIIKALRKEVKKAKDKDAVQKEIDEAVEQREALKKQKREEQKALKDYEKQHEQAQLVQDALAYKGSLIHLIETSDKLFEADFKDRDKKFGAIGYKRAILKALYQCYSSVRRSIAPMIKAQEDITDILFKLRIELLKSEDIKKAFHNVKPLSATDVMVGEKSVFDWFFNVHPLEVNRHVFESVGAYPASSWNKFLDDNPGTYPTDRPFKSLSGNKTPQYALLAGMVMNEPRISERPSKNKKGTKQRLSVVISDHFGKKVSCSYDFDTDEYDDVRYTLDPKEESLDLKNSAAMEVRDRYKYIEGLLNLCYKTKRPVVLKGRMWSRSGTFPWMGFSWAAEIDDVIDRIPGRDLLIVVDEESIVNHKNIDVDDADDVKKIDVAYEQTLTAIRKMVFMAEKDGFVSVSKPSVYVRDKKTNKTSVSKEIEYGGGARLIVGRKRLNGTIDYYYLNKSDDKGRKIDNEYYDGIYMLAEHVRFMISGKPYLSEVEFTKRKIDEGEIMKI